MLRRLPPSTNDAERDENKTRCVLSDEETTTLPELVQPINVSVRLVGSSSQTTPRPGVSSLTAPPTAANLLYFFPLSSSSASGRVETTWHIMGTVQPHKAHINASICFCLVHGCSFTSESHCLRRRRPRRKLSVRKGVCGVKA